jgi:hypothetical protein
MRLPRPIKNFEKEFAGRLPSGASKLVQLPSSGARRWCRTRLVDEFLFRYRPRSLHAGWTGFPAGCGFSSHAEDFVSAAKGHASE